MCQRPDTDMTMIRFRQNRALHESAAYIAEHCVHCDKCVAECAFLVKHGTPGRIAATALHQGPHGNGLAFQCSLCGLCAAVCPLSLKPDRMFLEMRRESHRLERLDKAASCVYLGFEQRGISRHLTYYALPRGCDTILFPGCALASTRPQTTIDLFAALRRRIPALGMVLDCCTMPSHDLGRIGFFDAAFGELRRYLLNNKVRHVLTACPSCYKIFKTHGGALTVKMVYELLSVENMPAPEGPPETVTIHDPCVLRFEAPVQSAVRSMAARMGYAVEEMRHQGATTFCCGEGASVRCTAPELAETWSRRRVEEALGRPVLTYCAGCDAVLGKSIDTRHILDLFFENEFASGRKGRPPRFPRTCWNRMWVKHQIKRGVPAAFSRERTAMPRPEDAAPIYSANRWAWLVSRALALVFSAVANLQQGIASIRKGNTKKGLLSSRWTD